MSKVKLALLIIFIAIATMGFGNAPQKKSPQKKSASFALAAYKDNQCVICHLSLTEPLRVSAHFYEWLNSKHEEKGVSCDKCHGGDPAAAAKQAAHNGMLQAVFPQSRLHPQNLAETCSSCHREAVAAFVQSKHYLKLKDSGNGPSCTTCHHHMATSVIYWPPETANLCANCHQAEGNPAAKYAQVPNRASEVIAALSRADEVIAWSRFLISEGRKRRLQLKAEENELSKLDMVLKSAKLKWHEFDLDASRQQADQVFIEATKIKNALAARGL